MQAGRSHTGVDEDEDEDEDVGSRNIGVCRALGCPQRDP